MHALEPVLEACAPDLVLVYGDTNTTLAGALSCARLEIPLAHVEAGMRSFDCRMPEERNRVLTDHLCELLLCSTAIAVENLAREGIARGVRAGRRRDGRREPRDGAGRERALATCSSASGSTPGGTCVVTAHRAGNVDDPERLRRLVELLGRLPLPAVFPVHPRTGRALEAAGVLARLRGARA